MRRNIFLLITLLVSNILLIGNIQAKNIAGRVSSSGTNIKGVVVTDGTNFTTTNNKGEYSLEVAPQSRFVYISTPSGYNCDFKGGTVKFYKELKPTETRYNFTLIKKANDDKNHIFIAFADPQVWAGKEFSQLSQSIDDMHETILSNGPTTEVHAMCAGDIVSNDHTLYGEYNKIISRLNIPVYSSMGNHDMTLYGRAMELSERKYEDTFGPSHYSYNVGKVHYITLNDNFYIGRDYFYIGYLEDKQLAWLEKDLSYVPKGSRIVLTLHIPTSCEPSDRKEFQYAKAANTLINHRGLYELLKGYKADIISGHTHTMFNQQIAPNIFEHVTAALSGAWWQGSLCTDGTPKGYGVYAVKGDSLTWYYKSTGYSKDYQIKLYDGAKYPEFKGFIVANIWNTDDSWSVEFFENGVSRGKMERFTAYDPEAREMYSNNSKLDHKWIYPSASDHFFRAKPQFENSLIEVVATDRFGNQYRKNISTGSTIQANAQFDVLIIGGGTSGTAAGISAARNGAKTLLVEEHQWLGGMLTSAGVSAVDGNFKLRGALWAEFRDSLAKHYGSEKALATGWVSNILFEPSVGNRIFKNIAAKEKNLQTSFNSTPQSFKKEGDKWSVKLNINGIETTVIAKIIIDATELGDVAKELGVPYKTGMDSKDETGEDIAPAKANSIIQDLTYAMILKEYPYDVTPVKPANYDPSLFYCCCESEKCINPKEKHRVWSKQMMITYGKLPNNKYMINWPIEGNDYYVDVINLNNTDRAKALEKAKEMSLSFLYYLQTELGFKRLGLADDEYPTADKLPFIPYHRESRRIDGVVKFSLQHITDPFTQNEKLYRTACGVGDYPVDQHHARYSGWDSLPNLYFHPIPSYGFPLGIVIPKEVKGLIVAEKSVSVTNIVNGSSRLQPVVLQIGEASGILAALAVKKGVDINNVSVRDVQKVILEAGGYLLPYLDLKTNDNYFKVIQRIGVTGILKGKGLNKGWENQTWFYTDSLISCKTLEDGLNEVYAGNKSSKGEPSALKAAIPTEKEASGNVTLDYLVARVSAIGAIEESEVYSVLKRDLPALKLNETNKNRELTRLEIAIIIDRILNPFGTFKVDLKGNFIN